MARTYCDLAKALYFQKRYAAAEPLAKWALAVRDADNKASSDAVYQCLFTLASIQCEEKHYSDAEPLLDRALAIQEKELPPGHVNTLYTLDRLATVYREQGKYKDAEPVYLCAIAILERRMPNENLDLAYMAEQYATMLRRHRPLPGGRTVAGPRCSDPRHRRRQASQGRGRRRPQGPTGLQIDGAVSHPGRSCEWIASQYPEALSADSQSTGFRTTGGAAVSLTTSRKTSGRA